MPPATPPTTPPITAPKAVFPAWWPITQPATAPEPAPIATPLSWSLIFFVALHEQSNPMITKYNAIFFITVDFRVNYAKLQQEQCRCLIIFMLTSFFFALLYFWLTLE